MITSDPINSWMHGTAALYSIEYFESVQAASQPGRRGGAVDSALREGPGHREVRAGDVSRGVSQRDALDELDGCATDPICGTTSSPSAQLDPTTLDLADVDRRIRRQRETQGRSSTK